MGRGGEGGKGVREDVWRWRGEDVVGGCMEVGGGREGEDSET